MQRTMSPWPSTSSIISSSPSSISCTPPLASTDMARRALRLRGGSLLGAPELGIRLFRPLPTGGGMLPPIAGVPGVMELPAVDGVKRPPTGPGVMVLPTGARGRQPSLGVGVTPTMGTPPPPLCCCAVAGTSPCASRSLKAPAQRSAEVR